MPSRESLSSDQKTSISNCFWLAASIIRSKLTRSLLPLPEIVSQNSLTISHC